MSVAVKDPGAWYFSGDELLKYRASVRLLKAERSVLREIGGFRNNAVTDENFDHLERSLFQSRRLLRDVGDKRGIGGVDFLYYVSAYIALEWIHTALKVRDEREYAGLQCRTCKYMSRSGKCHRFNESIDSSSFWAMVCGGWFPREFWTNRFKLRKPEAEKKIDKYRSHAYSLRAVGHEIAIRYAYEAQRRRNLFMIAEVEVDHNILSVLDTRKELTKDEYYDRVQSFTTATLTKEEHGSNIMIPRVNPYLVAIYDKQTEEGVAIIPFKIHMPIFPEYGMYHHIDSQKDRWMIERIKDELPSITQSLPSAWQNMPVVEKSLEYIENGIYRVYNMELDKAATGKTSDVDALENKLNAFYQYVAVMWIGTNYSRLGARNSLVAFQCSRCAFYDKDSKRCVRFSEDRSERSNIAALCGSWIPNMIFTTRLVPSVISGKSERDRWALRSGSFRRRAFEAVVHFQRRDVYVRDHYILAKYSIWGLQNEYDISDLMRYVAAGAFPGTDVGLDERHIEIWETALKNRDSEELRQIIRV